MKSKVYVLLLTALLMMLLAVVSVGCSDDDDYVPLCSTWVLVSYGNESNEVLKEANGYYYEITFQSDGRFTGRAAGSRIEGEYSCSVGHKMTIKLLFRVKSSIDEDQFFVEHLFQVNRFSMADRELRLYYSKDEYFKFRVKE